MRIVLPAQVIAALRAQEQRIKVMKMAAGKRWQDHDLVFPSSVGTPFDATNLYHEFQKLGDRAGGAAAAGACAPPHVGDQRSARRHRPAGGDGEARLDQPIMVTRYQHVDEQVLREAATRVGVFLPQVPAGDLFGDE